MFANVCRIPGPGSILRVSGFRARNRRVNRELKRAGSNNPGFKFPGPGNPARCPSLELTAITPSAAGSADYFTVYNLTFCPFSYALFGVALRRSSGLPVCTNKQYLQSIAFYWLLYYAPTAYLSTSALCKIANNSRKVYACDLFFVHVS